MIYIYVNDFHEALYFIRGTDAKGALLYGRYAHTTTFAKGALPPVDKAAKANWLPAPEGQFALIVRTYVPTKTLLDGTYKLPDVQRV